MFGFFRRKRIAAYLKKKEASERNGLPNEKILSEVTPMRYCGEGWSMTRRARIGLEYDENGLLKRKILYEFDDEDRLVREQMLWHSTELES